MGAFTRGDVVLFPFPYTDLTARKIRPCLVISETMRDDIILCQITSQGIPRDEYSVPLSTTDTRNGNLNIESYVRVNMIFTASIKQIMKKVCEVKDHTYSDVVKAMMQIIARK